ncbi:hypothetical protein VTK73DRAFT_3344 [Phialemonium thermophilum]|uniref:Uncharacterized protein n=1 Tax=Phialemonium thermophilum TaxID=223376 RepID=A0ABR3X0J4_9PEZI
MSSSRSAPPASLALRQTVTQKGGQTLSPKTAEALGSQKRRSFSSSSAPPSASTASGLHPLHSPKTHPSAGKPSRNLPSPTVNAHSYCGRHTDQYLFGGRTMADIFRAIVHRRE